MNSRFNIVRLFPWVLVVFLCIVLWMKSISLKIEKIDVDLHQIMVERIEAVGKLEVIKYSFRDVLEHQRKKSLWGVGISSKTLLIIGAEAVACVDLTKIKKTDIDSSKGRIIVKLPPPEICYIKVDHERSRVYNTEMSMFDDAEDKLVDDAYREAEGYIKNEVEKTDILSEAKENTKKILQPLLTSISNKEIVIEFK